MGLPPQTEHGTLALAAARQGCEFEGWQRTWWGIALAPAEGPGEVQKITTCQGFEGALSV